VYQCTQPDTLAASYLTAARLGSTWLLNHSVPVYRGALAASSFLAWSLVPCAAEESIQVLTYRKDVQVPTKKNDGRVGYVSRCEALQRGVTDITIVERSTIAAAASGKAGGFLAGGWGDGSVTQVGPATNHVLPGLATSSLCSSS